MYVFVSVMPYRKCSVLNVVGACELGLYRTRTSVSMIMGGCRHAL